MGYAGLKQLIEQNAWREAGRELGQYMNGEWDDELAVLAATVFSALGDWEGAYTCIAQGLQYNYRNYELYLLLGNYYERKIVTRRGSVMKMRSIIAAMKMIAGSYSSTKGVYSTMTGGACIRFRS